MPMTQAEYVGTAGMCCPKCRSGMVCAGFSNIGETVVSVSCVCGTCGATWEDRYELAGYDNLEDCNGGCCL